MGSSGSGRYDGMPCVRQVPEPERRGIVELKAPDMDQGPVKRAEEKPEESKSGLGIMPACYFNSSVFDALNKAPPGKNG